MLVMEVLRVSSFNVLEFGYCFQCQIKNLVEVSNSLRFLGGGLECCYFIEEDLYVVDSTLRAVFDVSGYVLSGVDLV